MLSAVETAAFSADGTAVSVACTVATARCYISFAYELSESLTIETLSLLDEDGNTVATFSNVKITVTTASDYTQVSAGDTYTNADSDEWSFDIVMVVVPEGCTYSITTNSDWGVTIGTKLFNDEVDVDYSLNPEALTKGAYYIAVYGGETITVTDVTKD